MTEEEVIDVLMRGGIEPEVAKTHPGWKSFLREMLGRRYGPSAATSGWLWFCDGWEQRDRVER